MENNQTIIIDYNITKPAPKPNKTYGEVSPNIKQSETLAARIKKISKSGEVTVEFSSELFVPSTFREFDNDVILITIKPGID